MPRYFRFDEVKIPTNKRIRHIIVHYVRWVEVFGYVFCALVAAGIAVAWFYYVDELAVEKTVAATVVKAREHPVKTTKEAVVTRVMVADYQKVKSGDPLVEVVDDPKWVAGWKMTQQLETMAKGLDDLIKANTPAAAAVTTTAPAATTATATAAATTPATTATTAAAATTPATTATAATAPTTTAAAPSASAATATTSATTPAATAPAATAPATTAAPAAVPAAGGAAAAAPAAGTPAAAVASVVPPPPPGLELAARARDEANARIAAWRAAHPAPGKPLVLTAPADGEVMGTKDLQGKTIAADGQVLKVVDFSTVRLTIKLTGTNVERVRTGQTAKIEIQPNYGVETAVRGDVRLSKLQRQRIQLQDVLDVDDTKKLLTDRWKEQRLTSKEDRKWGMALPSTEVSEVEMVTTRLKTERMSDAPAGDKRYDREPLAELDLDGTVIDGAHNATYRVKEDDEKLRGEILQRIVAKLKGRETQAVIPNPLGALAAKARGREVTDEETPLRVLDMSQPNVFLKVKTSLPAPKTEEADFEGKLKAWEEESEKALETARETERIDRFFDGTVELKNVPPVLQETLRALTKRDPAFDLKSKVTVVVGRRRLALVLFRQ